MKDQNQFNLKRGKRSSSSYTEVASKGKNNNIQFKVYSSIN